MVKCIAFSRRGSCLCILTLFGIVFGRGGGASPHPFSKILRCNGFFLGIGGAIGKRLGDAAFPFHVFAEGFSLYLDDVDALLHPRLIFLFFYIAPSIVEL